MIKNSDILLPEPKEKDFDLILQQNKIDTSISVEKPPTILSLKEVGTTVKVKRILTLGNMSTIKGKMKAKKTFFISLITAATIKGSDYNDKFIGELPENKKLVIYVDTEQSDFDSYHCIRRIEKMSETKENFIAFNFRKFTPKERIEIIEFIFSKFGDKIALMIIDGVADLVMAINDEIEATEVTSMLMKYSGQYNCHIITVIHENKMNDFATGHIGSAVMKKSEIIISVTKCSNDFDSSDIKCDMSRGPGFEPFIMTINEHGYPYVNSRIKASEPVQSVYYDDRKEPEPEIELPF